jgi:hypothetical protein
MSLLFKLASLKTSVDTKLETSHVGGAANTVANTATTTATTATATTKNVFVKQHVQYIFLLLTIIISLIVMKYVSAHVIPEGLFETEDSDEEDKKKRQGMIALTSAYILVLVIVYIFINFIVIGIFGISATLKDRDFMDGVGDWIKYFVKDGTEVFIFSYVYIIGILLVLGIAYIFYTTVIDQEFYNDIHFQSNIKISQDDDEDNSKEVEEKTQADKYLYHYAFLLIFVGIFTLCYGCFFNGVGFAFGTFIILAIYLTTSSLALTNLYRQNRTKTLFYIFLQIIVTCLYVLYFEKDFSKYFRKN